MAAGTKHLQDYADIVGQEAIDEIRHLAEPLRGARVLHVNATAFGGGVAELLFALVPLMRDVGLEAEWRVIYGTEHFFAVTKALHNALQGADVALTPAMREVYRQFSALNAEAFGGDYDYVVIHDPQPAALRQLHGRRGAKHWIWRCHLDTSTPSAAVWAFLRPFVECYDAAIFTQPPYVPADLQGPRLSFIAPTIDPLSAKNRLRPGAESRATLARLGIDTTRPLLTQVSRFDRWKDPLGVIDVYRMVKVEVPALQLALVGSMATDDPEGWTYYEHTVRKAGDDYDIHILHNLQGVGNAEVNAFQSASDVVVQKSTREGFALSVAKAIWKGTPVVGSRVGGIPLQIVDSSTGYLVDNKLDCAKRVFDLLRQPDLRARLGQAGREHVRTHFLCPRNLRDYLRLFTTLKTASSNMEEAGKADGGRSER